jgi:hypothetical protein
MIALASLAVFISSCKKEDTANSNASILGKWNVMNLTETYYDSLQNLTGGDTLNYAIGEMVLDFKDNGMLIETDENGEKYTLYYTLSGMKLTISDDADMSLPLEYTVQNLTGSELNFYVTFTENDGSSEKETISAKR